MNPVKSRDWFPLPNGGWKLVDAAGNTLDTLHIDWASLQYRDIRGRLLSRVWTEAREACEARAGKTEVSGKSGQPKNGARR